MATKTTKKAVKTAPKKAVKTTKAAPKKAEKPAPASAKATAGKKVENPVKAVKKKTVKEEPAVLPSPEKQEIIAQFAIKAGDTGSPEVQVALLTYRVEKLTEHLKAHAHDNHSRRGLLSMIAKRRRLINFLEKVDKARASEIAKKVGLKK